MITKTGMLFIRRRAEKKKLPAIAVGDVLPWNIS